LIGLDSHANCRHLANAWQDGQPNHGDASQDKNKAQPRLCVWTGCRS
jgi:hypothetical protein